MTLLTHLIWLGTMNTRYQGFCVCVSLFLFFWKGLHWPCKVKVTIMSNSLRPSGLYSPWNSLDQNTGVGALSLLQVIFPTQVLNPGLPHCRWILYQSHKVQLNSLKLISSNMTSQSELWQYSQCFQLYCIFLLQGKQIVIEHMQVTILS